jgi:aminoglycoside phosphotransferase (APT) family kinase protein
VTVVTEAPPMVDAMLPGLAVALSAHPPGTGVADDCRIRSVEWVPRRRCRVVHEVRRGARTPTLVAYEVTPAGTTASGPADDRSLPGLRVALDPVQARPRLAAVCGIPVQSCSVTPIGYRPDSRAVVAYDVVAGSGRSRLYAKLLAHGADRYAAAATAIASSARRRGAAAPVPDLVALWPDLGAVVQRAAPGQVLSTVLRDPSRPEAARLRYARRLGELLAEVHAAPSAGEAPWSAEDELTELETLLPSTCHADPAVGRSLAALLDRLADRAPGETDPVLSHGAFRAGQVLVGGGHLSLLDLDTVSRADAARDAGNALAYLSWAEVRGASPPGLAAALHEAFLAGYAAGRTQLGGPALAWWSAASMAKIAGRRYRTLATAEWSQVPELLRRAGTLLDPASAGAAPTRRPLGGPGAAPPVDPLDPDRMTEVLRSSPSLRGAERLRVLEARPLAEAVGRRRVVRYEVEGLDADRTVALVGKSYTDRHRSSIAYENLRLLREVFAASPLLDVPEPVVHVPPLRMVFYRAVDGTLLDRLAGRAGADTAVLDTAALAARWLATLHASAAVLTRRLDLEHEVADAGEWASRVANAAPSDRAPAFALADRLAVAAADLPAVDPVPVHRDFHAGHVLAVRRPTGSGGVVVLDLDEARMGDPASDVASAATCLEAAPWPGATEVRTAFLAAYGVPTGPDPARRLAFYSACASMKIAKQLVTGRGPVLPASAPQRAAALTAVLRRGLACLDG